MVGNNGMPEPNIIYACCACLNIVLGIFILLYKKYHAAKLLWPLAGLCWMFQMGSHFFDAGFYSLSGVAPTFSIAAFVLCLWQGTTLKKDYHSQSNRPYFNALFLSMLAGASLITEAVHHNTFMMTYAFAVLFFLSRPLSLGLSLYALGGAADCLLRGVGLYDNIWATSKDTAFLAAIIFLGGEIAGCFWGFMGWGTTWRWSGNFYFSAMIFVLFMVSLHTPRSLFSTKKTYILGFTIPLVAIVLAMMFSKVLNV